METTPGWGRGAALNWMLIAALGALAYGGSLDNAFQYDDLHSIVENPHLRSLANIPRFFAEPELFSADPRNAMYRPLVLVSYALNHALSGYEVWSYHLLNLGVHLGVGILVWVLVSELGGSALRARLAGLLFALHPLGSEPVNYLSSRSESLCAFFFLLAFIGYIRGGRGGWLLSVMAFAAALLTKSVGLALLPVLLFFDLLFRGGWSGWVPLIRRHGAYWLVGLLYLVGTWGAIDTAVVSHPVRSLAAQGLTQLKALVYYLKLLGMPWGLSVEHQFALARGWTDVEVLLALLLVGSGGVLLLLLRPLRQTSFWLVWCLLTLLPSSAVPLNVLVNEHRLYLPAVGFAVVVAGILAGMVGSRGRLGVALAAAWLGSYGALAWQRTQVWQSPESLWADAVRKGPRMPRPHLYLGDWHQQSGRYEQALAEYALVRKVYPEVLSAGDLLVSYNNEGAAFLALGRHNEAIEAYRRALTVDPTYERSRVSLDALVAEQESVWDPRAHALHKKGLMLLIADRPADAVPALEQSLRSQVRLETYLALGMAYQQCGEGAKARQAYLSLEILAPGSDFARTAGEKLTLLGGGSE